MSSTFIIAASAAFLLAGFVKGVTGLGLPTVAIGLLSLVMPPAQAAALLVVPTVVTNVWQLAAGPNVVGLLRRLWPMMAAICIATWLAGGLLAANGARAIAWLGLALIAYAAVGLLRLRLHVPARAEPWLSPVIGAATGVVTAATGVATIPAVPYLQALGMDQDDLVQALGLSFTVSFLALAVVLARADVLQLSVAGSSSMALVPAFGGMFVGQWLRAHLKPSMFRVCFLLAMLILGADLAYRGGG